MGSDSEDSSDYDFSFVSNAAKNTQKQITKVKCNFDVNTAIRKAKYDAKSCNEEDKNSHMSKEINKVLKRSHIETNFTTPRLHNIDSNAENDEVTVTPPSSRASRSNSRSRNKTRRKHIKINNLQKRSKKTESALQHLANARVLSKELGTQTNLQINEVSVIGDNGAVSISQRSLQDIDISIPEVKEISIKIRWKHRIVRITVNSCDILGLLFEHFAMEVHEKLENLMFKLNEDPLLRTDTYDSLKMSIVDIIVAEYKTSAQLEEDMIELKLQSIATSARHASKLIKLRKSDQMESLMKAFAEQENTNLTKLTFKFEGNIINYSDTPESLDLEDGDCIDVCGIELAKSKGVSKSKGNSKKSKKSKQKNPEILDPMIVIDDTMFTDDPLPNTGNDQPTERRRSTRSCSSRRNTDISTPNYTFRNRIPAKKSTSRATKNKGRKNKRN